MVEAFRFAAFSSLSWTMHHWKKSLFSEARSKSIFLVVFSERETQSREK